MPSPRGMNDQRDRGRRKKHHRRRLSDASEQPDLDRFESWLSTAFPREGEQAVEPSLEIKLKQFLQNTPDLYLAADEKLRQLAIHWEAPCAGMNQPTGWLILKRIYEEAIRLDPRWRFHFHSMSLSARRCAGSLDSHSATWTRIMKDAESACLGGLEITPQESLLHLSLGRIRYASNRFEEALGCFEQSLANDPKEMWAALYRGHCLHDLNRWDEAVSAYQQVDRSYFDGDRSWRAVLLRDQLAVCQYFAGNQQESIELFEKCFHQYESNPGLLFISSYLEQAADFFPDQFSARAARLFQREGFD